MLQGSHCPVLVHELSPLVLFLVQDSDRTITTTWIVLRVSLQYTRCRPTHPLSVQWWARVAAHCWFNAGQLCTTLPQHYSNIDRTHDSSTPASTAITGRLTNVASMLNIIPTKTLWALIIDLTTNIIVNIIISEHLLKTKVQYLT